MEYHKWDRTHTGLSYVLILLVVKLLHCLLCLLTKHIINKNADYKTIRRYCGIMNLQYCILEVKYIDTAQHIFMHLEGKE